MVTNQVSTRVRRMLTPELAMVYRPSDLQWSYSHHPFLGYYKGTFYAMWSNGERDEDDLRQRVLYATSADGVMWGRHKVLFEAPADRVYTACGFFNNGESLVAYCYSYSYAPENVENGRYKVINDFHRNQTLLARTTEDGENWGEIIDLQLPFNTYTSPRPLQSGRLLMSGNVCFCYSDEKDGLSGWKMTGLPPFPWPDCVDDAEGLMRHTQYRQDDALLMESSFYQKDDGVIQALYRSGERILYGSTSTDNGETWGKPEKLTFTNCNTKFNCNRLPDGRCFIVGSPDPAGNRCPFVITLSEDGEVFDREYVIDDRFRSLRHPGKYKGGIYAYPDAMVVGEKLYVICSVNKEDIHVYSFPISQLSE